MAYELLVNHAYPEAATYRGKADRCQWEFKVGPEQIPGMGIIANKLISQHEAELREKGYTPLYLKVWVDKAPTWATDYRVEIIAHGSPGLPLVAWIGIIAAICVILAVVIYFTVRKVSTINWGQVFPPEIIEPIKWGSIALVLGAGALLIFVIRRRRELPAKGGVP